jgi:hypothetical protein
MHGLDACDLCGRQVPTDKTRGELWRLGWEWAPAVTCAVLPIGLAPTKTRTRWTCGACWPWELMAVEILDGLQFKTRTRRAMEATRVMDCLRAWRQTGSTLIEVTETAAVMWGYRPSQALMQRIVDDMVKHANNVNAKGQITRGWFMAGIVP